MQTHHAADVDDAAVPLAHHQLAGSLAAEEGAFQVGVDDLVEVLFLHAQDELVGGDAGVVHQHIQSAEGLGGGVHQGLAGGGVGDVRLQGDGLHPIGAAVFGGLFRRSGTGGVVHRHIIPLGGQGQADGPADAPPAPGDQGGAAGVVLFAHARASLTAATAASKSAMVSMFRQVMALPTVFFTKPEIALPGPTSMTVSTPSSARRRMVSSR